MEGGAAMEDTSSDKGFADSKGKDPDVKPKSKKKYSNFSVDDLQRRMKVTIDRAVKSGVKENRDGELVVRATNLALAKYFGVDVPTIEGWIGNGNPPEEMAGELGDIWYDLTNLGWATVQNCRRIYDIHAEEGVYTLNHELSKRDLRGETQEEEAQRWSLASNSILYPVATLGTAISSAFIAWAWMASSEAVRGSNDTAPGVADREERLGIGSLIASIFALVFFICVLAGGIIKCKQLYGGQGSNTRLQQRDVYSQRQQAKYKTGEKYRDLASDAANLEVDAAKESDGAKAERIRAIMNVKIEILENFIAEIMRECEELSRMLSRAPAFALPPTKAKDK